MGNYLYESTTEAMRNNNVEIFNKRLQDISQINPELLSLLLSITKVPKYGLPSILQVPMAINIMKKIFVDDKLALNQYNSDVAHIVELIKGYTKKQIESFEIIQRFKVIDAIYLYNSLKALAMETYTKVDDLYNPKMIKEVNEKFFKHYPLDLNVL